VLRVKKNASVLEGVIRQQHLGFEACKKSTKILGVK